MTWSIVVTYLGHYLILMTNKLTQCVTEMCQMFLVTLQIPSLHVVLNPTEEDHFLFSSAYCSLQVDIRLEDNLTLILSKFSAWNV